MSGKHTFTAVYGAFGDAVKRSTPTTMTPDKPRTTRGTNSGLGLKQHVVHRSGGTSRATPTTISGVELKQQVLGLQNALKALKILPQALRAPLESLRHTIDQALKKFAKRSDKRAA